MTYSKPLTLPAAVIFAGKCPAYIDAVESNAARELYDKSVCVPFDKIDILDALKEFRTVQIKNQNGTPTDNLIYNMRQDNSCSWLFVAHGVSPYEPNFRATSPREYTVPQKIKIYVSGECHPTLYDTISGNIYGIEYKTVNGKTVIDYDLYQGDSILLKLSDTPSDAPTRTPMPEDTPSQIIRINDKVEIKRCEPNVLLLDRAEFSLDGEEFRPKEEILKLDNICRKKLAGRCAPTPLRSRGLLMKSLFLTILHLGLR